MGIYDRDYQRDTPSSGGGRVPRAQGISVTWWIIGVNIAVHILALTVFARNYGNGQWSLLHEYGHFSTYTGFQRLEVWRLVTFQFLHDPTNILHIVFNMFGLWVFGPIVEEALGRKKYLAFYLMCGICGGLMYLFLNMLGALHLNLPGALTVDTKTPLVGASAGVFGVIVACAYVAPEARVQLLFPPIPLKMKWFAYGYVAIAAFNLLFGGHNAGGDAAHIGGAIAGFFFIRNSHHLADFFDIFGDSRPEGGKRKPRHRAAPGAPPDDEIDRILAKVSQHGIQSLTAREKKKLEKASRDPKRRL